MQINVTSPVSHHISSNSKAVAQTIIAVVYYHESKSLLWWFSVFMVVVGALSYAIVRMKEENANSTLPQTNNGVKSALNSTSNPADSKPPEVDTDDHSQV